ncbi:MAG: hypothetical protein ACUVXF_05310, partial [Desulfobaccales bacterium]
YELSYLHQFTPHIGLLTSYSFQRGDDHLYGNYLYYIDRKENILVREHYFDSFDEYYHNIQAQLQVRFRKHRLLGGYDYFTGPIIFHMKVLQHFLFNNYVIPIVTFTFFNNPVERSYSFYLLDYWRITPWLVAELGVFRDVASNARGINADTRAVTNTLWSPRLGLNIWIGSKHTVRLAVMRYLDTHQLLVPLLIHSEVGGLSWVEDTLPGSEVRQAGASWETQWDNKTFTVLRLAATRLAVPDYFPAYEVKKNLPYNYIAWQGWRRYQASLFLNRILTNSLGLRLGVAGKRILADESYRETHGLEAYTEMNWVLGLSFLTPKGWQGGITNRLVYQYLRGQSKELFDIVNLRFGKELANKRGLITFEVQNLFNRHFGYRLEPYYYSYAPDFYPARRFIGKIAFYF